MSKRREPFDRAKVEDLIADWQSSQPSASNRRVDFHEEIRKYIEDQGAGELDWLKRALRDGLATPEKIKVLESFFQKVPGDFFLTKPQTTSPSSTLEVFLHDGTWEKPTSWLADSWLLRSEYALVPFHSSRAPELEHLESWCEGRAQHGIQLIHGQGGQGKTRLATELVKQLRREHWTAGFLKDGFGKELSAELVRTQRLNEPLCIVVDYAEKRIDEVVLIVETLSSIEMNKARLVLLARAKAEWWQAMSNRTPQAQVYTAQHTQYLPLAFSTEVEIRQGLLESAASSFSRALNLSQPAVPKVDLSLPEYSFPLLIGIAALSLVRGRAIRKGDDLITDLISREQRVWETRAARAGLREEVVGPVISQGVALATLIGGCSSMSELLSELSTVPLAEHMPKSELRLLSQIIAESYPEAGSLGALRPDLIGEHLVDMELSKDDTLYARSLNNGC